MSRRGWARKQQADAQEAVGLPRLVDVLADEQPEGEQSACEAMLLFWYVGEGETVAEEDDLAEIETAKAVVVVKAPASGVVQEVLVREGDAVQPGQRLAAIAVE